MFLIIFLVLNLFLNNIRCENDNDLSEIFKNNFSEIQKALEALTEENASEKIKNLINLKRDDNSHWCCKIDPPVASFQQTRLVSFNVIMSGTHICGYTGCGLWGWSSCEVQCTNYWTETRYTIEHYTVYQQQECPSNQLTCCVEYFFVLGHCLHITELANNLELLQELQLQGIVIPGLAGK